MPAEMVVVFDPLTPEEAVDAIRRAAAIEWSWQEMNIGSFCYRLGWTLNEPQHLGMISLPRHPYSASVATYRKGVVYVELTLRSAVLGAAVQIPDEERLLSVAEATLEAMRIFDDTKQLMTAHLGKRSRKMWIGGDPTSNARVRWTLDSEREIRLTCSNGQAYVAMGRTEPWKITA